MTTVALKSLGHYQLLNLVGDGGYGKVYLAKKEDQRPVALKVLCEKAKEKDDEERLRNFFLREIYALGKVSHENIIRFYESAHDAGQTYFTMEYINGQDLKTIAEDLNGINPKKASLYIGQVARALQEIRNHGLVHRDIKPENILVSGGKATLIDFGLVYSNGYHVDEDEEDIYGTTQYMSPEYITGDGLSILSDIYSLGITFYYLLRAEFPYKGSDAQILRAHVSNRQIPILDGVEKKINILIQSMTEKDPDFRPSPEEVVSTIEEW